MKTFACPTCNVGALGATVTAFSANYSVNLYGRTVNAGEVFTAGFLTNRTAESVQRLAGYISNGSGIVGADGSLTVNNFKVAPAGSLVVARINQLKPSMAAAAAALGTSTVNAATSVPVNPASSANRVATVLEGISQGFNNPTPTTTGAAAPTPSLTQTLFGGAIDLYVAREQSRAAEAAQRNVYLNPSTAPAQGAAANTSAMFGPGADLGGGQVRAGTVFDESGQRVSGPLPSLPTLPGLPVAPPPAALSLPVTGAVIQPAQMQSISPSTGLPTPMFPGIPPSLETGDGSVQLNSASLANLMDQTAKAALPPLPGPAPFYRQPAFLIGLAVVAAGAFVVLNRRRRRR